MLHISSNLPRIQDPELLNEDPLACLATARERHGDCVVLRDGASLLSHNIDCPGVVALFGAAWHRQVLTAPEDFIAAPSTARALSLPETVVGLTRSLHVMHGRDHTQHKAIIAAALAPSHFHESDIAREEAIARFVDSWRSAGEINLFAGMQRLAAEIAVQILFGAGHRDGDALLDTLPRFFALRRRLSEGRSGMSVVVGLQLDKLLHEALAVEEERSGVSARLAQSLPEPQSRAHLNVLFMSLVEPVAVAATWMLLLLTQRPRLRRRLRAAWGAAASGTLPMEMKHTLLETLRLLSPNALMVRVAEREVNFAGMTLPPQCEIVLAPFLAHRDPAIFVDPTIFRPTRWESSPILSPFDFMPFGAGAHACVGKRLAEALIAQIVGGVLTRIDPILSTPEMIDWRIDITFRPRTDFKVAAVKIEDDDNRAPADWRGPVAELVQFEPEVS